MASQTITGPDLQFTQDNLRCYAYSGVVAVGGEGSTGIVELLGFQSGSGYILAKVQFYYPDVFTEDFKYSILFNGEIIFAYIAATGTGGPDDSSEPDNFINIIIPPHTEVSITALNVTDDDTRTQGVTLTGDVHEHLPVRN